jgi:hypothetical protein
LSFFSSLFVRFRLLQHSPQVRLEITTSGYFSLSPQSEHAGEPEMPFFKCRVSRSVFTNDLKATRIRQSVYVEAQDEIDAKKKAGHPKNWLRSAMTCGRADKSPSFLLTVEECRQLVDHEVKALRLVDPTFSSTLFHQSPFWSEDDDSRRA